MLNIISITPNKPDRVNTIEKGKNELYHTDYARWVIGNGINQIINNWHNRIALNRAFYANRQWEITEDLEQFLMDESGQDRNRVKVTFNYIQPMVEQGRGNAMRMNFMHNSQSISPLAVTRKEQKLNSLLFLNDLALIEPGVAEHLQENYGIGENHKDTERFFNNTYVDSYIIGINRLIEWVSEMNDLDSYKGELAGDVYLTGACIMKPYIHSEELRFERIIPENFGYDTGCKKQDLSDSGYFFLYERMLPTEIYERYKLSKEQCSDIEKYISTNLWTDMSGRSYLTNGRVDVYKAYWRDCVVKEYGYVKNEFEDIVLEAINCEDEYTGEIRYTNKDLIAYKDLTEYQRNVLNGSKGTKNNKRKVVGDLWRYCEFIPGEIMGARTRGFMNTDDPYKYDIPLSWGVMEYQENDLYSATNMVSPFKIGCWSYSNGEVLAPVDIAINPQRMINRLLSIMENQLNNQGGTGVVVAEDMLGDAESDEVAIAIKRSEPIFLNTKGIGVNQAVAKYDASLSANTTNYLNIAQVFKSAIEQTTGVNEAIKGQTQGQDQLVGVMQLMIQRGSVIQEPVYNAIERVFKGCYQHIATCGKRLYSNNEKLLMDITGELESEAIILSKDINNEEFRVFIKRTIDDMNERQFVDTSLDKYLQLGLIDKYNYALLVGRANRDEMYYSLRDMAKKQLEADRINVQQQQQMMAQQMEQETERQDNMANAEFARKQSEKEQDFSNNFKLKTLESMSKLDQLDKKEDIERYKADSVRKVQENNQQRSM